MFIPQDLGFGHLGNFPECIIGHGKMLVKIMVAKYLCTVTTSGTAVLPDETKVIVGEILQVILTTFNSKLVINEHSYTMMIP